MTPIPSTKTEIVHTWGYKRVKKNMNKLYINIRPNTTDEKVIQEVLIKNIYQRKFKYSDRSFVIDSHDIWIDIGANIGTFALLVASMGARVYCYEAESTNYALLKSNIETNGLQNLCTLFRRCVVYDDRKTCTLFKTNPTEYNQYRHGIYPITKKHTLTEKVKAIRFADIIDFIINRSSSKTVCVKMDIEGAEIDILERTPLRIFNHIDKLVFEYSFDVDSSVERFRMIVSRLRKVFGCIHHKFIPKGIKHYTFYPSAVIVYCLR